MRIALLIDTLASGGAQRQLVELGCQLSTRAGVDVGIAIYHDDVFYADRLGEAGIRVDRLRKAGSFDPLFPLRLRDWLTEQRSDLVHAFLPRPAVWAGLATRSLARERRPRLVASERNDRIGQTAWGLLLQRLAYARADAVTVNARGVGQQIRRKLGVPAQRIRYLPNGIDLEYWDREMAGAAPITLDPGAFRIGMVGRLAAQKNHALLLEALQQIAPDLRSSWRVWMVGARVDQDRELRRELEQRGLAGTITLMGPQRQIAAFMRQLDVLVLPSAHEGFPNVVLEAMASRVPVVATRVGDVPALLEGSDAGHIVASGDAAALAGALRSVHAASESRRQQMGRAGRARVEERYCIQSVATAYLDLYAELLAGR